MKVGNVNKWWVLCGYTGDGSLLFLSEWDHLPSSDEVDGANKNFGDDGVVDFILLEEIARGRQSVKLTFASQAEKRVRK